MGGPEIRATDGLNESLDSLPFHILFVGGAEELEDDPHAHVNFSESFDTDRLTRLGSTGWRGERRTPMYVVASRLSGLGERSRRNSTGPL